MYFLHRHRPTSLRISFAAERIMNASLKKNGIDKNIYNNNINNNDNNNININDNKYNHISIKHVKNNININNSFLSWSILIKIFFISSNKNMPVQPKKYCLKKSTTFYYKNNQKYVQAQHITNKNICKLKYLFENKQNRQQRFAEKNSLNKKEIETVDSSSRNSGTKDGKQSLSTSFQVRCQSV